MDNKEPDNEQFEELCAGYVLNALEPGEREEFHDMLQTASDEQLELFRKMQSAANQIAFTVEENKAPSIVMQRILDQIQGEQEEDTSSEVTGISSADKESTGFDRGSFAIAASFALLLVTLSLIFYSFNLSSEISDKEEIIVEQQTQITELQSEIQQKEELLSILESREVDLVIMSGMEVNPNGYGKIIWDSESKRALLQVSNLPAVPTDKEYQLWIIKNNKPVSAGLFAVDDPKKDSFFKLEEISADEQNADAFAVTMEPKGGMPQPTGDMYLMGNMNSN